MRRLFYTMVPLSALVLLCSGTSDEVPQPVTSQDKNNTEVLLDCDTVIVDNGYSVRIIRDNGEDIFSGLNLFSDDMKNVTDKDALERIERDLYILAAGDADDPGVKTRITKGKISDFKSVTPDTECRVSSSNSKFLVAEWQVNGKPLTVRLPLSYETAKGTDRSKTEEQMIRRIKDSAGKRTPVGIDRDMLESYGEDMYLLPGGSYHNKDINANVYLDSLLNPVWDAAHPVESIAGLFVFPSDAHGDVEMEVTVLKHDYGTKETFLTTVGKVISEFEKDGCMPFWGVEKMADGRMEGALFLYNKKHGYDHVLKIECSPEEIIGGKGRIKARASLFIPTNNVDNLYAPYVKKSEEEKIKY